jgi:GNAT superfamily N-acetyltransferase
MIRKAGMADAGNIAMFLEAQIETSMFLLSNLEEHGTDNTEHPHGTAYFLRETGDGITGVFGATNNGFLLCQLPGLTATEAQTYAHLLKGYTFFGMSGDDAQVSVMLDALPLGDATWQTNRAEPLYRLSLAGLTSEATTRHVTAEDVDRLTEWFEAYFIETKTKPAGDVTEAARKRAEAAVGAAHIRLLEEDGAPTAMAAVNAQAGLAIQIGGVFVPQDKRGQGRGGRVTQALIAEAGAGGAQMAFLFAASEAAAKTYENIGFQRCGDYRVALLDAPKMIGHAT